MDPWTIVGWLLVVCVGLIALSMAAFIVALFLAVVMGIVDKNKKSSKINIVSSRSDGLSDYEFYRNSKGKLKNDR